MATTDLLLLAFQRFDAANRLDPNTEVYLGVTYPKEVLYGMRMTECLNAYCPNASEALRLASRCQHLCRWEIPRERYDMDRRGYLQWRLDLKKFHAIKAGEILRELGYDAPTIDKVGFLLQKKHLKRNAETQILEDVVCLVFLEFYFESFAQKHPEDKTIAILQKTWGKMSQRGQEHATRVPLSKFASALVSKALTR